MSANLEDHTDDVSRVGTNLFVEQQPPAGRRTRAPTTGHRAVGLIVRLDLSPATGLHRRLFGWAHVADGRSGSTLSSDADPTV